MARKQAAAETSPETKSRRSWAPDHDDHFIYWWVKHQGQSQAVVAGQLGISQGTVSRTIQRYERWQSRAEAQLDGRLNHAERLRAQRWLTYERNELILASCLRIAAEMEGFVDVSSSADGLKTTLNRSSESITLPATAGFSVTVPAATDSGSSFSVKRTTIDASRATSVAPSAGNISATAGGKPSLMTTLRSATRRLPLASSANASICSALPGVALAGISMSNA